MDLINFRTKIEAKKYPCQGIIALASSCISICFSPHWGSLWNCLNYWVNYCHHHFPTRYWVTFTPVYFFFYFSSIVSDIVTYSLHVKIAFHNFALLLPKL
jgi:hypothetical protein